MPEENTPQTPESQTTPETPQQAPPQEPEASPPQEQTPPVDPNYQRYLDLYGNKPQEPKPVQLTQEDIEAIRQMARGGSQFGNVPLPEPQPSNEDEEWIREAQERLALNDFAGFAKAVRKGATPKIEKQEPEFTRETIADLIDMRTEMSQYAFELRQKNQDLMPLASTIESRAADLFEQARRSGSIKDRTDAVTAYKAAADKAVQEARELVQKLRGTQAQEANTVQKVVETSTPGASTVQTGAPTETQYYEDSESSTKAYLEELREKRERMRNPAAFS